MFFGGERARKRNFLTGGNGRSRGSNIVDGEHKRRAASLPCELLPVTFSFDLMTVDEPWVELLDAGPLRSRKI